MKILSIIFICISATCAYGQAPSAAANSPRKVPAAESVFILGEIRAPQILPYTPELTVSSAIASAGGISEFGGTPIYIIRDGAIFLKTTMRNIRKTPLDDPKLKPKDVIYLGLIANAQ